MKRIAAWLMTLSDDKFLPTCQYSVMICTNTMRWDSGG